MNRPNQYISEARIANGQIWEGIATLQKLKREADAMDFGNTLPNGEGDNGGILADDVLAVVYATQDAFSALLAQGHSTNMSKIL